MGNISLETNRTGNDWGGVFTYHDSQLDGEVILPLEMNNQCSRLFELDANLEKISLGEKSQSSWRQIYLLSRELVGLDAKYKYSLVKDSLALTLQKEWRSH